MLPHEKTLCGRSHCLKALLQPLAVRRPCYVVALRPSIHGSWPGQQLMACKAASSNPGEQVQQQRADHHEKLQPGAWISSGAATLLRSHGSGGLLAYLTFSNVCSVGVLCAAWLSFTAAHGATPLSSGGAGLRSFAAYAAGAYAALQAARPLKVAVGVTAAPLGTAALRTACRLLLCSERRAFAVLLVLQAAALLGCIVMTGLAAATMAACAEACLL
jgi:hypothetical protein